MDEKYDSNKILFSIKYEDKPIVPWRLVLVSSLISIFLWICSFSRHFLFQSNVYDLGIFDQWFWLISKDILPISSTTKVHVLADHGAWVIYIFALLYRVWATVNWLFITQAIALSFTAIPIWWIGRQAGLSKKLCWFSCGIWWLQPVVFNTNIFGLQC